MADSEKAKPPTLHELLGWTPPPAPAPAPARPTPVVHDTRPGPTAAPGAPGTQRGNASSGAARAAQREPAIAGRTNHHFAVVDGSNVAHAGVGDGARLANILAVRRKLIAEGYEPLIVADAALRHQIDDPHGYEALVRQGAVKQAPAGTDADYFILAFARELDAHIVSNDQFRDRSALYAAVRSRVIRYMVLADEVVFDKRTARRDDSR